MDHPESPYCMAAAVDGVVFERPPSVDQMEVVDAAGIRTKEGGIVLTRCLNSLDYRLNCPLNLKSSNFAGNCVLGKLIVQTEPRSITGVYREPEEGIDRAA